MNISDVEQAFEGGQTKLTDELHEAIQQSIQKCDPAILDKLMKFLSGGEDWQQSTLTALSKKCSDQLNDEQLRQIEPFLKSDSSVLRMKATGILDQSRRGPSEALVEAMLVESKKSVQEVMLSAVLGLAGVPDRQSVKLAMAAVAAGTPITRALVDDLVAEHAQPA